MSQSDSIDLLASALAKAQASMKPASMNKINPHFRSKYADLASIIESVRKPLTDNGLSFTQTLWFEGAAEFHLQTTLLHTSGQWLRSEYPLPQNATPQQMGSALTYARRYSLSAITGTAADEDDDGDKAEVAPGKKIQAPEPTTPTEKRIPMPGKPDRGDWNIFCRALCIGVKNSRDEAEAEAWKEANRDMLDRMADKKFPFQDIVQDLEATLARVGPKHAP